MKKLMIAAAMIFAAAVLDAHDYGNDDIWFYGADFSEVKVFGAYENEDYFAKAFVGINTLFALEADKYNPSRIFGKRVQAYVDVMVEKSRNNDYSDIKVYHMEISAKPSGELVAAYDLPQTEGVGVVFIARLLNKQEGIGTFDVVVFDIATRKIIQEVRAEGEAGGSGLRNYWARSIYEIMCDKKLLSR